MSDMKEPGTQMAGGLGIALLVAGLYANQITSPWNMVAGAVAALGGMFLLWATIKSGIKLSFDFISKALVGAGALAYGLSWLGMSMFAEWAFPFAGLGVLAAFAKPVAQRVGIMKG